MYVLCGRIRGLRGVYRVIIKTMSKRFPKKVGRKWFDGKSVSEVKQKLMEAYSNGLSMVEVRLYVGIGKSSLSRYLASNPVFRDRLELLRKTQNIVAKNIISQALKNGDIATAKWWLEHKDEEFKRQPTNKMTQVGFSKAGDNEVDKFEIVIIDTGEKFLRFNKERTSENQADQDLLEN